MPVATSAVSEFDKLNTVAVVPLSSGASSTAFLRNAASNLCHAIAQGSGSTTVATHTHSDDKEDPGASSFVYAAPQVENFESTWHAEVPWHISNRYYDVDVTLNVCRPELLLPTDGRGSTSCTKPETLAGIPAYVVLVDRSRPLEDHRRNLQIIEEHVAAGFDAEISIVAGISTFSSISSQALTGLEDSSHPTTAKVSKPSTVDLVTLYADAGWEYIAIDDDDDDDDYDSDSDDDEGLEQGGIDRIREALQNYMWNGLQRKEDDRAAAVSTISREACMSATEFTSLGFSNESEQQDRPGSEEAESTLPSVTLANETESMPNPLDVSQGRHASPGDLDEQLANLFLSRRDNATDLSDLEAFLESEDPSWPAVATSLSHDDATKRESDFENNFDDFLPFQSAVSGANRDVPDEDDDAFPDETQIASMQSTLFGSDGMDSRKQEEAHDLGAQLHQLQWHAQRVRNIPDPDKRRKEAALIALAFSMQWAADGTHAPRSSDPHFSF